jgi:hypothetical protein
LSELLIGVELLPNGRRKHGLFPNIWQHKASDVINNR